MRISDWSSDVCSSDLELGFGTYSTGAERILGVNSVNKADAGTFVLDLAPYIEDSVDLNRWSADVGSINVSADRKSVVEGKSVSVRVDLGGRRSIKKNNNKR